MECFPKKTLLFMVFNAFLLLNHNTLRADPYSDTLKFLTATVNPEFQLDTKNEAFARTNIYRGFETLQAVLSSSYVPASPTELMKDVLAVNWTLFHFAVGKNQGFDEGTYFIEDPDDLLYNFFLSTPNSYQRISTHLDLVKKVTNDSHYGIDILGDHESGQLDWNPYLLSGTMSNLLSKACQQAYLLPGQKSHILFGRISAGKQTSSSKNILFLKIESNGTKTWSGFFKHGVDLYHANFPKKKQGQGQRFFRVERVDLKLRNAFDHLLSILSDEKSFESISARAKELGIRFMIQTVQSFEETEKLDPKKREAIREFFDFLASRRYDNISMRMSNEVIFSDHELRNLLNLKP